MFSRKFNPIILLLLGLAVFGFAWKVMTDPMGLLKMILIFAAVGGIFYFLYKRFIAKRMGQDLSQYKQAARYSSKRYKNDNPGSFLSRKIKPSPVQKTKSSFTKKKRKNNHNFKVIEGKKGKKKNRAL